METSKARPTRRPARGSNTPRTRPRRHLPLVVASGVLVGVFAVAAFIGASFLTDRPQFCGACHEMRPYVTAWAQGPHKSVWCVDCHVGRSYTARMAHKFVALREVVDHFSGKTDLPLATPPSIADQVCQRCHATVAPRLAGGFDHAQHAQRASCAACHSDAGHVGPQSAVDLAGPPAAEMVSTAATGAIATIDHGVANVPGHVTVLCTRCHDLRRTGCPACHTPPAGHFEPAASALPSCDVCHQAGGKWAFAHPDRTGCEACHAPSASHFKPATGSLPACNICHKQAGRSWAFSHPGEAVDCTSCHALPSKHFAPATASLKPCTQCHRQPGVAWSFTHPGSGSDCQSCHTPPANHSTGQCSQCHHKTGVSFAFSHPAVSAPHGIRGRSCVACHPNGYTQVYCTCHGGDPRGD